MFRASKPWVKRFRNVGVALGAIAIIVAGTVSPVASAEAAQLEAIDASSIVFTNSIDPNTPLLVGENSKVTFNWSLEGMRAVSGDTFSMTLPQNFQFASGVVPLTVGSTAGSGSPESAGVCTLTPGTASVGPKITCVLGDYVDTHDKVSGSLWIEMQTLTATSDNTVEVKLGDDVVVVKLPDSGIKPPNFGPIPTTPGKWAFWTDPERTAITWYVDVPGDFVGTANPLLIEDTFAAGLTLVTSGANAPTAKSIEATASGWGAHQWSDVDQSQWSVDPTGPQSFTISMQQPIAQDHIYRFTYVTTIDHPENAIVGDVFENTAVINGTTRTQTITYSTIGGGSAGGDERGGFVVAKEALEGNAAGLIPVDTEFQVDAVITEPGGAPRAETLQLTAGGEAKGVSNLPAGTTVHLSEVRPSGPVDVEWGTPRFSTNANPSVTLSADESEVDAVIVAGGTYRFSLVNTATEVLSPLDDPTFAIGDYTWNDLNRNGVQDAGEPPLGGVKVSLRDAARNAVADANGNTVAPVLSDSNGAYHFDELFKGEYVVHFEAPDGFKLTQPSATVHLGLDSVADVSTGLSHVVLLGEGVGKTSESDAADGVQAAFIDRTIDAGFVRVEDSDPEPTPTPKPTPKPTPSPAPKPTPKPGCTGVDCSPKQSPATVELATTGGDFSMLLAAGTAIVLLGAAVTGVAVLRRRKSDTATVAGGGERISE
ncbi:hypothetical protein G7068_13155 [Leucobacter viscericola]|uniref:Uncharacterized protein n=1 Tax=Leucobacter viscericola TaxID=2714935 RepID=A0A6G7XI31_9MICO|nr:SdrD B-like domain-containing protein [Leucobacter viscericola]QIK64037.1 hypothetical protein G7068_13155 [Leucobacter viscericola]